MVGRYFVIDGNVVMSIAAADAEYASEKGWEPAVEGVGEGWLRDGPGEPWCAPDPAPEPVPVAVTGSQGQLALLQTGNLAAVREFIAGITDEAARLRAEIEFSRATWERSNPFLTSLWLEEMGRSEDELDALFRLAATL